jgi:hypothetical protein
LFVLPIALDDLPIFAFKKVCCQLFAKQSGFLIFGGHCEALSLKLCLKLICMLARTKPTKTIAWKQLVEHHELIKNKHLRQFFSENPNRFEDFSIRWNDLLFDYSKNRLEAPTPD